LKLDRLRVALILAFSLGAAYRLWGVLAFPTIAGDDALLSLNVATRSYTGLLETLDYDQVAPVLFLWLLRLAADLGGVNELALRFVPLVAGIVLPIATWSVARRVLDPWPAVLAAAFVALSPILIRYSAFIKPYELDALVTVVLAGLTLGVLERPDDRRAWGRLAGAGVVALLASLTAPFVLAGAGASLAMKVYVERSRTGFARTGALGVLWIAAFAASYLALYRDVAGSDYMQEFWGAGFLTPRAFGPGGTGWQLLARLPLQMFDRSRLPFLAHLPIWALIIAGAAHVARGRGTPVAPLLTVPLAAALVVSAMQRYPVSQRTFLYAAPLVMVLLAGGVSAIRARWPSPPVTRAIGALVGLWLLTLNVLGINRPRRREGMRQLVGELRHRGTGGVPVYLFAGAVPMWTFYATDWRAPDHDRLEFIARVASSGGTAFVNAPSRGRLVTAGEGDELVLCKAGAIELIGLAPGIQAREVTGFLQPRPDSGWAEREAERIVGAARPDIWLVFASAYLTTLPDLLAALRARGAVQVEAREWRSAKLYRYRVDDPEARIRAGPCP